MSATFVRMKKEARALAWPWCAVIASGVLPAILHNSYASKLNLMGFFFGVPLLATLSFGNEFYHRTFSLLLTQPASRMQLWAEKTMVMCAAVSSAALVSGYAFFHFTLPRLELTYNKAAAVAFVIVIMASATFWTLATRSALGGLIVTAYSFYAFYLFVGDAPGSLPQDEISTALPTATASFTAIFVPTLCFAGLMLWLGARKLVRFQFRGASSGEDLMMSGPSVMPEAFAEWFRCRPSGELLNLIRKEFRLLRPVWLIEIPVVVYLAALAAFRILPLPAPAGEFPKTVLQLALTVPAFAVCMGLAGLAGILSLGEERTTGTHAWHMVQPVSARLQWFIKLAVAMPTGLACAVLLPHLAVIAGGALYGSPLMFVDRAMFPNFLILYPLLTFSCFWCACAANGTVRAAVWALPATATIYLASPAGLWLGAGAARSTGTLKDVIVSSLHGSPLAFATVTDWARGHVVWLFIPTLLAALYQSCRLFRTPPQNNSVWILRCLAPLAVVTILFNFSVSAGFVASAWQPFEEARSAIDALHPGSANLELTAADLAHGSSMSPMTERWLKGATIRVTPGNSQFDRYRAAIHLASGLNCRMTVTEYGETAATCGK